MSLRAHVGPQPAFHGGESYELTEEDLRQWKELFVDRVHPEHYLLLVETGDEVLDYRAAVRKYRTRSWSSCKEATTPLRAFPNKSR